MPVRFIYFSFFPSFGVWCRSTNGRNVVGRRIIERVSHEFLIFGVKKWRRSYVLETGGSRGLGGHEKCEKLNNIEGKCESKDVCFVPGDRLKTRVRVEDVGVG